MRQQALIKLWRPTKNELVTGNVSRVCSGYAHAKRCLRCTGSCNSTMMSGDLVAQWLIDMSYVRWVDHCESQLLLSGIDGSQPLDEVLRYGQRDKKRRVFAMKPMACHQPPARRSELSLKSDSRTLCVEPIPKGLQRKSVTFGLPPGQPI